MCTLPPCVYVLFGEYWQNLQLIYTYDFRYGCLGGCPEFHLTNLIHLV